VQYRPFAKHSQYSLRQRVFLQEQLLAIRIGRLDFRVMQFGQHSGVHGSGDRKQLQLYIRHYSATKHTQLWILGGGGAGGATSFISSRYRLSSFLPEDLRIDDSPSDIPELDLSVMYWLLPKFMELLRSRILDEDLDLS
jgi:hypothetical protein